MKGNTNVKTIEGLGMMVAKGFEAVDKRFDEMATKEEMNTRFNAVDQRLGKLDYRIDEIHEILARFEEGDILDLQKRIKILERTVKAMAKQMV